MRDRAAETAYFVLCKPWRLCYTQPVANPRFRSFLGSSAVEHSTVNRMVAGSNPARGANQIKALPIFFWSTKSIFVRWGHLRGHMKYRRDANRKRIYARHPQLRKLSAMIDPNRSTGKLQSTFSRIQDHCLFPNV
jgi:hypothetical protein